MDKTILVTLRGHDASFRLEPTAEARLARYLDRAAARLSDDPDRAEVLGDLEESIGDKLRAAGDADRLVTAAEMEAVLDEIGAVETGRPVSSDDDVVPPKRRRLRRVRKGQQIAGVCSGLAAYSEVDVDWVRTVFILGALVTAGLLIVVYIAMALILPITDE